MVKKCVGFGEKNYVSFGGKNYYLKNIIECAIIFRPWRVSTAG